jgi:hypothetical protein
LVGATRSKPKSATFSSGDRQGQKKVRRIARMGEAAFVKDPGFHLAEVPGKQGQTQLVQRQRQVAAPEAMQINHSNLNMSQFRGSNKFRNPGISGFGVKYQQLSLFP